MQLWTGNINGFKIFIIFGLNISSFIMQFDTILFKGRINDFKILKIL